MARGEQSSSRDWAWVRLEACISYTAALVFRILFELILPVTGVQKMNTTNNTVLEFATTDVQTSFCESEQQVSEYLEGCVPRYPVKPKK
jgi:hypothetical protein